METIILGMIMAAIAFCFGYIAEGEVFLKSFNTLPTDPMFQRLLIVSVICVISAIISKIALEKLK